MRTAILSGADKMKPFSPLWRGGKAMVAYIFLKISLSSCSGL